MQVIDRRLNQKNKSTVNRQRFLRRYRKQIKQAITKQISKRGVTDVDQNESISIPSKDITEPTFRNGDGGLKERIYPGNKEFDKGDRIKRPPPGGQGAGRRASDKGEGEDDFSFEISSDEYMEILFEDLELPNLKKNQLTKLVNFKPIRSGFNTDGTPSNIDIVRSLKGSLARRIASQSPLKRELKAKEEELSSVTDPDENKALLLEIEELKKRIKSVPYLDTYDLRYKNFDKLPQPTSNAVMFCLMDVSGSMDQQTKEMAKRFFILLYMFLKRTYKDVDVIYIRHHTQAKEVDEQEFFYSQETGGTIVSSALKLMLEIQQDRYPAADWNIYAAQASDGDNWNDDSRICHKILTDKILKLVRYYTYVEITQREPQNLWYEYLKLKENHKNFAMQKIAEQSDIYPVFREFFQKQSVK
ncbi:MAG: YeaH/YhbH family protein [Kangiellaceae bacterium]|nr:YeaH/YhbH family protein [Kangiellaceae bacterium]MCW8999937.1 YeaH/YhbH family protein [Kangiellaceae bacterium]